MIFVAITTRFEMKLNQTNRTRDSKDIASVTSYFSENEAENLQNGDLHLAQITDFEMGYLENHLAQSFKQIEQETLKILHL